MTDYNRDELRRFIETRRQTMQHQAQEVAGSEPDERRGFSAGVRQGMHGLGAAGGGLVAMAGEALRSDRLYDAGMAIYDRQSERAAEHDLGYGLSDFFSPRDDLERAPNWGEYISHSLGVMLPSMGLSVGTGGVGGIAARGVARGVTRELGARGAARATQAGQIAGAVGSGVGEYTGSLYGELGDAEVSLVHGAIAGTLDAVLPAGVLRVMSPGLRARASDDITRGVLEEAAERGLLGNVARRGGQGGLAEGVTEGLQSLVEQHARHWVEENGESLLANAPDIDWRAVIDGMGVGTVAGTGISAPAGVLEGTNARRELARLPAEGVPDPGVLDDDAGEAASLPFSDDPQAASDLGNRIQMAMTRVDDIAGQARGTFEATTRLRNVRRLVDESERHFERGELELAERKLARAQEIESSLLANLQQPGSREHPAEGELVDSDPFQVAGLLEQDGRRLPPGDPSIIYGEGPTLDATGYEPQARTVRRDEGLAAQREGEARMREQAAAGQPQLTDQGIIYGEGPVAGNANTGLDQPFAGARFTDTQQLDAAAAETDTSPTPAQAEAGNYRKGRVRLHGFEIAIENPRGSTRRGTAPDGAAWESTMAHHYGDIKRTTAADGDNLDVFIGENPASQRAFVVDQVNEDGGFDEHKVMLGFDSLEAARDGYLANYDQGWQGLGAITEVPIGQLKEWVKGGDTARPFSEQGGRPHDGAMTQEALFSLRSVVRGDGRESGIPVAEAQRIADEFMASYNGNIPLDLRVVDRQEEAYGPENTRERVGTIKGAYHSASGRLVLAAANLRDAGDARDTLAHEVLGHYGINTFTPDQKRQILDSILAVEGNESSSLAPLWRHVRQHYADMPRDIQAEEVFAWAAEQDRGALGQAWDRVLAALQRALRSVGLIKAPMTRAELHDMARTISREIRDGQRHQQTFPQRDQDQFRQEDGARDDQSTPAAPADPSMLIAEHLLREQGYSLEPSPRQGAPRADEVQSAVRHHPELASVQVVQHARDLPPQAVIGMAARGVNPADVRGMFIDGELFVVADNVHDVAEGVRVAVHEAVGHQGIRSVLGGELMPVMNQLYLSFPRDHAVWGTVRERYSHLDTSTPEGRREFAEELVAHLAETNPEINAWQRFVARVRDLLRQAFPELAWSENDVRALIQRSRQTLADEHATSGEYRDGQITRRADQGSSDAGGGVADGDGAATPRDGGGRRGEREQPRREQPAADVAQHDAGDQMFSLRNADFDDFGDVDRAAAAKIGRPPAAARLRDYLRQRWEGIGEKVRTGIVDQYAALQRLDQQVHGRDVVKENITASSWVLARMSGAASGALYAMMTTGRIRLDPGQKVIDLVEGDDSQGLGAVLGQLGDPAEIERFFGWIAGNRSRQLAQQGRENLFEPAEIEAMATWNRGTMADGRSRVGAYAQAFREFQQYRDDVLAIAEATGVISADARAMWRDEFYVPFYRVQRDEKNPVGPMPAAGLSRQKQMKKLKGGKENVNDLLENTMLNFHYLLEASLKNQAATMAIDNALRAGIAERVPESNRDTQTSTYILRDGKKAFYQIDDPLVFNALTSLADPGMNGAAMKFMRQMKRIFTVGVTATPQFQLANLMRDTMQAVATSPVSKNAFANVIHGGMSYRDQKTRARMMAAGGAFHFGHVYGTNPDEIRAQMARVRRETFTIQNSADLRRGLKLLAVPWRKWTDVNNFTENINRARIYEQNVEERGALYANFEARDLIDFGARGAWPAVRILTDIVPFLNARIQGLDKIYRSGVKPGVNVVAAAFGYGQAGVSDRQAAARFWAVAGAMSLAAVTLYLHNHDDEEFQKLEDWQKDTYYHVFIGGHHIQIPRPFEVGAVTTLAERLTEQFVDDRATGKLFRERLGHMLTQTFAFSPVPQAVQPMMDVAANRDAFTGRPIESAGMERLSPELRRRESTSRLASGVSRALNRTAGSIGDPDGNPLALSPVQVDHLIGGYFGQLGSWVAGAVDVAWNTATGHDKPARRWYEYQPVRRFYRNLGEEDIYTKYGTIFYEGLREAQRAHADMRELREVGRLEEAQELAENQGDLLRLRTRLNRAQRQLRTISQQMVEIQRSSLSAEEKRQRIDRLRAVRNQIQRALGEQVEEARRAG